MLDRKMVELISTGELDVPDAILPRLYVGRGEFYPAELAIEVDSYVAQLVARGCHDSDAQELVRNAMILVAEQSGLDLQNPVFSDLLIPGYTMAALVSPVVQSETWYLSASLDSLLAADRNLFSRIDDATRGIFDEPLVYCLEETQ